MSSKGKKKKDGDKEQESDKIKEMVQTDLSKRRRKLPPGQAHSKLMCELCIFAQSNVPCGHYIRAV